MLGPDGHPVDLTGKPYQKPNELGVGLYGPDGKPLLDTNGKPYKKPNEPGVGLYGPDGKPLLDTNGNSISDKTRNARQAGDDLLSTNEKGLERAGKETIEEVAQEGIERTARGGTYRLVDPATGETQYVGRTNDLVRRQSEHLRDPVKGRLEFRVDQRTDDYAVQRGREQMLYEQYRPPLNRIRPISPRNPRLQEYLDVARRFEEMMQ